MSKYLLIAGHGPKRNGMDPGAGGFVGGEYNYMKNKLFPAMKKYANKDFIFHDQYNVYDRGNISSLAKSYGRDTAVIEFHYDASSNQSASGGHVIIHSAYSPDSMDLRLRDVIKDMIGVRYNHKGHAGISGRSNLANVNRAKSGGVNYRLLELGFGTNRKDANVMLNQTNDLARKLVEAIKGSKVNNTSNIAKPSQSSKLSNNEIAKKVLRGDYGNGQARINKLTNEGYNPKVIQDLVDQLTGKSKPTVTPKPTPKPKLSSKEIAKLVLKGDYGNGQTRITKLTSEGYNPKEVQKEVDILIGKNKPSTPSTPNNSIKKGHKVTVKKSATNYATGQKMANFVKGNTYTVENIKSDRVLLKEITSWVKISDLTFNDKKPSIKQIKVDGYWGQDTTKALQKALNSTVDGIISGQYNNNITRNISGVSYANKTGSQVIKLLQTKIGVKNDGFIGPNTIKALQRYLGTPIDGVISKPSTMVKELQRRLNKGII